MFLASAGSETKPILMNIVPGKCGKGVVFFIQIESLFYPMFVKTNAKNWKLLRCGYYTHGCSYTVRLKNIVECGPDDKRYFDTASWEFMGNSKKRFHSCTGLTMDKFLLEQGQRIMREGVRKQIGSGSTSFSDVNEELKLDELDPGVVGDKAQYKRLAWGILASKKKLQKETKHLSSTQN